MKDETALTANEFVTKISLLSGSEILDCYHTQDTSLRLLLKSQVGEFILIIDGKWNLLNGKKELFSSEKEKEQSDHEYYEMLRLCASEIKNKAQKLTKIVFTRDTLDEIQLYFENGWELEVLQNNFGLISYQNKLTKEYVIYTTESNGKPKYFLSKS